MRSTQTWLLGTFTVLALAAPTLAGTATFYFADVGSSYLAFLPADDPLVGQEIVATRIYLSVEVFPGSDAADFYTDIAFPIEPFPGNESALALLGADLNWSGPGIFDYYEETSQFNGTFIARRYGAETPAEGFDGQILAGSRIEMDYVPEPGSLLLLALAGLCVRRRG